jgi:hypothetical protein
MFVFQEEYRANQEKIREDAVLKLNSSKKG